MSLLDRLLKLGAPATREEADRIQVRQLAGLGADLARPRHVVHVLYFTEDRNARTAAEALERGGYATAIEVPEPGETEWTLRAEGERVVSLTTVAAYRAWFEEIAAAHGGVYDGWEAARTP